MTNYVGLEPVPDGEMEQWLSEKLESATEEMEETIQSLHEAVQYGVENDEPYIFSYARLLNHIANHMDHATMVKTLSASLWMIAEADR